jgi:putative peptidoglycan lipid II flippase
MFASSITGAISWLYYADRIAQLPLGVFVISISTILLTLLSKYEANKNKLKIKTQIDSSCVLMLILTTISMVGLFAISDLIVDILFKRGKFGLGDVIATSDAIVMYAIGLPAFGFIKIFSVIFFAKQNTLTPFKVSSISMIINLILIFLLVNKLGHLGIALSLSLSSWINAALLYFFLWKKNYWRFDKILIIKVFKIIICSFITYTVLSIFYMLVLYTDYLTLNDFIAKVLLLSFLIFFSATLFFSLLRIMGIISFDKNKIKTFLKGERK